ncbi:hypothetical protein AB0L14_37340 [Streptomyces sp. NPDC052727]|uniref:hypothetical protein n=1 Tax=Streptomyces sp. NPDC052727 TaxID=3154854 RepID=UPI0034232F7D
MVDDLGKDWKTDKLRREAYKLMASAGSARPGCTTLATSACRGWRTTACRTRSSRRGPGHSDLSFTKRNYVHPDPQSLMAGSEKLMELLG